MSKIPDILTMVAMVALAVFVWSKWGPKACTPEEVIVQTDTIYQKPDTIIVVKEPPPKVVTRVVQKWDTIKEYLPVDTAKILDDYFAKNFYSDTTTDNETYLIQVNDTISRNRIVYRDIKYTDLSPTQIINNKIIKPSHEIYVGVGVVSGEYFSFMPTVDWKMKNDNMVGVGYDIANNSFQLSFKTKIFEK